MIDNILFYIQSLNIVPPILETRRSNISLGAAILLDFNHFRKI